MFDIEEVLTYARELCADQPDDIEVVLTTAGLNSRLEVAKRVAWDFPQFQPVVLVGFETEAEESKEAIANGLLREAEEIREMAVDRELLTSIDYLVLLAGMTAFVERLEEPQGNTARLVLSALHINSAKVEDRPRMALVAMAAWFSDYEGFRGALRASLGIPQDGV